MLNMAYGTCYIEESDSVGCLRYWIYKRQFKWQLWGNIVGSFDYGRVQASHHPLNFFRTRRKDERLE